MVLQVQGVKQALVVASRVVLKEPETVANPCSAVHGIPFGVGLLYE
jgi:hypothetical protein